MSLEDTEKSASPAWQRSEGKNPEGGLNEKGRKSLKAQGHDIKRPQPEGGPRKDSFCARMKGMKSKLTSKATANDPDSRINKSLRKWKCGSAHEKLAEILQSLSKRAETENQKEAGGKPGLWANIHAKKERGEAPAKPGEKGYPTAKNWKKVTRESEKKAELPDLNKNRLNELENWQLNAEANDLLANQANREELENLQFEDAEGKEYLDIGQSPSRTAKKKKRPSTASFPTAGLLGSALLGGAGAAGIYGGTKLRQLGNLTLEDVQNQIDLASARAELRGNLPKDERPGWFGILSSSLRGGATPEEKAVIERMKREHDAKQDAIQVMPNFKLRDLNPGRTKGFGAGSEAVKDLFSAPDKLTAQLAYIREANNLLPTIAYGNTKALDIMNWMRSPRNENWVGPLMNVGGPPPRPGTEGSEYRKNSKGEWERIPGTNYLGRRDFDERFRDIETKKDFAVQELAKARGITPEAASAFLEPLFKDINKPGSAELNTQRKNILEALRAQGVQTHGQPKLETREGVPQPEGGHYSHYNYYAKDPSSAFMQQTVEGVNPLEDLIKRIATVEIKSRAGMNRKPTYPQPDFDKNISPEDKYKKDWIEELTGIIAPQAELKSTDKPEEEATLGGYLAHANPMRFFSKDTKYNRLQSKATAEKLFDLISKRKASLSDAERQDIESAFAQSAATPEAASKQNAAMQRLLGYGSGRQGVVDTMSRMHQIVQDVQKAHPTPDREQSKLIYEALTKDPTTAAAAHAMSAAQPHQGVNPATIGPLYMGIVKALEQPGNITATSHKVAPWVQGLGATAALGGGAYGIYKLYDYLTKLKEDRRKKKEDADEELA